MRLKESVNVGNAPQLFHPSKRQKVEQGDPRVEGLMPDLGNNNPDVQRYLELITSKSYEDVLKKVQHYTGRDPATLQLPEVAGSIMHILREIFEFEYGHENKLIKLALDTVLSLPEFKLAKMHVAAGVLKYELTLGQGTPTLKDAREQLEASEREMEMDDQPDPADPDALTPIEELDSEIAETFSDEVNRRALARVLFQGNAVNKFYVFNFIETGLDEINPRLRNLYGIACAYIHLLYYAMPDMDLDYEEADECNATQGSCQVINKPDGTAVIKAAGVMLPYLIHEIVKCTFEYFSINTGTQEIADAQELNDEIIEFLSGPAAWKIFIKDIEYKDHDTIPLVFQRFLRLPAEEIKAVLSSNNQSKNIINRLVRDARRDLDEYEQELDDFENPNPFE